MQRVLKDTLIRFVYGENNMSDKNVTKLSIALLAALSSICFTNAVWFSSLTETKSALCVIGSIALILCMALLVKDEEK